VHDESKDKSQERKNMKSTLIVAAVVALLPACLFGVDGVVLINQATVMAAGGFPYTISSPGSYKLSGNLTMATSQTGNIPGALQDVAILISSSDVTLDLNGFSITVNNSFDIAGHIFNAIATAGSLQQIKIKNGTITLTSVDLTTLAGPTHAMHFPFSTYCTFEDLSISARFFHGGGFTGGAHSVIRRNTLNVDSPGIQCPSLVVENVGVDQAVLNGRGCVAVNNAP